MTLLGYLIFFGPYVLLTGLGIGMPIHLDWGVGWSIAGGITGFLSGFAWNVWLFSKMMDGS